MQWDETDPLGLPDTGIDPGPHRQRREFPRYNVQCRARIRIGKRHYSGYALNISQGGAKLRTISPIGRSGEVILRLPDLPPMRCQLRWTGPYDAGVSFNSTLSLPELQRWAQTRTLFLASATPLADRDGLEELVA